MISSHSKAQLATFLGAFILCPLVLLLSGGCDSSDAQQPDGEPESTAGSGAAASGIGEDSDGSGGVAEGTGDDAMSAEGSGLPMITADALEDFIDSAVAVCTAGDNAAGFAMIDVLYAQYQGLDVAGVLFARALSTAGAFETAMVWLAHDLEVRPDDQIAALELGTYHLHLRQYADAAPFLERVTEDNDFIYGMAQQNLGRAYRSLGRFDEAITLYTVLFTERGEGVHSNTALCTLELNTGALDACRARLEAGRGEDGELNLFLREPAALLAYLEGDWTTAEAQFAPLLNEGTPPARIQALRVLIPLAQADAETARVALEQITATTLSGELAALRALVAAYAGQIDEARTSYAEAIGYESAFADPTRVGAILLWRPEVVEVAGTLLPTD